MDYLDAWTGNGGFCDSNFEYRQIIKAHLISISMGVVIGMLAGMISAFYLAKLFNFDQRPPIV